ncbi:MAG TPA: SDR family oxidoreductase [Thermoplasmata archaeon]|nr:SDR family oxidoreductase [Thermoplasmata archaeon]
MGPFGITVNVVAPGVIDDPELPIADAGRREDKRFAVPRVGTGEDVASAVLFLVSEEAEFVTGDVLESPEAGSSEPRPHSSIGTRDGFAFA